MCIRDSNNTIPWWSQSATYQQIHDATDLGNVFGSPVAVINSIHLRKDGLLTTVPAARSLDLTISLGHTAVTAATATTDFATNLGGAASVVLPNTTVNLPALSNVSVPNPVGWSFPFTAPFTYQTALGGLCWEFRFHSSTSTGSAPLDACLLYTSRCV